MIRFWSCLLCAFSAASLAQTANPASTPLNTDVMVVAVARESTVLEGGISCCRLNSPGQVNVEPIAWITPSGEWKKILCDDSHAKECKAFNLEYLKKPHAYTVISADGRGALVQVEQMNLATFDDPDSCFGYGGIGAFSGASISFAAVAAESNEFFTVGESAHRLPESKAKPVRAALIAALGDHLASFEELRVYQLQLEKRSFFVIQRALQDYGNKTGYDPHKPGFEKGKGDNMRSVFIIGTMKNGRFMKISGGIDEGNELILGTIHLKNGRDFLITSVNDLAPAKRTP